METNTGRGFRAVCFWDEAIDLGAHGTNLDRYIETRDFEELRFRAGETPVVFRLRAIPNRIAVQAILPESGQDARRWRAFQASVVRVENVRLDADGVLVRQAGAPGWEPAAVSKKGLGKLADESRVVSDAEMEMSFDPATILEIGEVALTRTFLPRGMTPSFALPPSSQRLLISMTSLFAAVIDRREREKADAARSGSAASDGSAEAEAQRSSGETRVSGPPGDATATAIAPEVKSIVVSQISGEDSSP